MTHRLTGRAGAPLVALVLLAAACEGADDEPPSGPEGEAGATQGAPLSPGTVEVLATGLEIPWGIDFLPGGDALVTERDTARVLRVGPDGRTREVGRVPDVATESESGLLGLAVSPHFGRDGSVYLFHTTGGDARVVRAEYSEDTGLGPTDVVLDGIPRSPGGNHSGGRLAFGPDGMLYVATGDAETPASAQDPEALSGKILRVTPDGEPAPGNPVDGSPVYSSGHRNVQGLAFAGDRLLAAEFGPDVDDELNAITAGADYGWPEVTGAAGNEDFVDPLHTWPDVDEASPSGIAVAGGSVWAATLQGEGLWWAALPERGDVAEGPLGEPQQMLTGEYGRLRTVVPTPEGDALWVSTSNREDRGDPAADDDRLLRVPLRR